MKNRKRILVLMGGWSSEQDNSIKTGCTVINCIKKADKYDVSHLDFSNMAIAQSLPALYEKISVYQPDVVFNALHGAYGEDGRIQSVLDMLQIPYTHSGTAASAIGLNKFLAKQMVKSLGVLCPHGVVITKRQPHKMNFLQNNHIQLPFVIKPINEGFSHNTVLINDPDFSLEDHYDWERNPSVLVEKYIEGKELSVLCLGNKAIGAIEIATQNNFFDIHAKLDYHSTQYILPPDIIKNNKAKYQELLSVTTSIHNTLLCKDISRCDFIIEHKTNSIYFLEINTHPGLIDSEFALVPKIARFYRNMQISDVVEMLIANADYYKL